MQNQSKASHDDIVKNKDQETSEKKDLVTQEAFMQELRKVFLGARLIPLTEGLRAIVERLTLPRGTNSK